MMLEECMSEKTPNTPFQYSTCGMPCEIRSSEPEGPPPDAPKENIQVYVSRRLKHLAHVQKSFLPALDCS